MSRQTIIVIGANILPSIMQKVKETYPNDEIIVVKDVDEAAKKAKELGIQFVPPREYKTSELLGQQNDMFKLDIKEHNPWPAPHSSKSRPFSRHNRRKGNKF